MKVPISKGWLFKWENDKVTKPVIIWLILSLWENERKKVSVISTCICIHSWSILYEHRPDKQGVNFWLQTYKIIQIGPLDSLQAKITKRRTNKKRSKHES